MAVSVGRERADAEEANAPSAEDLAVLEPPPGRDWRRPAGVAAAVVVLLGLVLWFSGGDSNQYETVSVAKGDLVQRITAVGQLEPVDHVEIGSDLNGDLLEILVDENDEVAAGDVLARLDPEPFDNAVATSRAAAAVARANLEKARVDLERTKQERDRTERLFARGAATKVERSEAGLSVSAGVASVDSARASYSQALASLERAEQDLRDTVIKSPIAGVVMRRLVDEGQTVVSAMSATPLFEVASDLRDLEVEVDVDEADVGLVSAGQPALFTVAAWPDRVFEATVSSVDLASSDESSVVVYGTQLDVDNTDGALRPGMTATAEIQVGEIRDAWLVPTIALRYRPRDEEAPKGDHVWTLDGNTLVPITVQVGGSDGATSAVRADELENGMTVVVGGGR